MKRVLVFEENRVFAPLAEPLLPPAAMMIYEGDRDRLLTTAATASATVGFLCLDPLKCHDIELLREMRRLHRRLPIVVVSSTRDPAGVIEAMKCGAVDCISLPCDPEKLRKLMEKAVSLGASRPVRYAHDRHSIDSDEADVMVGTSEEMMEIWKMVGKVAESDATVLIQGESGTGKELLARAIYLNSPRREKPFLALNCAALPENLLESELFGHEKGAFTDASVRKAGKFEQCNGGTLFLDEIGEMSPGNQGKLLRVIETQEFQRIGGSETVTVDVRIIAATNRSLIAAVKEKAFRRDLFYRLRVISFFLPPLRERGVDIPVMVELFLGRFARKYGKEIETISPAALELLATQHWPGNIRELKNVMNSAVLLSSGKILERSDLEPHLVAALDEGPATAAGHRATAACDDFSAAFYELLHPGFESASRRYGGKLMKLSLEGLEKALVRLALEKTHGNQVASSTLLGLSRNTLRDRIDRYGLS